MMDRFNYISELILLMVLITIVVSLYELLNSSDISGIVGIVLSYIGLLFRRIVRTMSTIEIDKKQWKPSTDYDELQAEFKAGMEVNIHAGDTEDD